MGNIKTILQHNRSEILLVVCLGIILLSSINLSHDWGGDFAQYLGNSRNLINGSNSGPEVLDGINFAPATRGAGFSLLLSPVFLLLGEKTFYFTTYISIIFLLCALVLFQFFKKHELGTRLTFLLTCTFVLHPEVFALKFEILPTFPFLILLYLLFLSDQIHSSKQVLQLALLTGILISIRNVGWVVYLVGLIHLSIRCTPYFKRIKILQLIGFTLIVPFVDKFIKWLVFGNSSSENLSWYSNAFHVDSWQVLWTRLLYYYDQVLIVFKPEVLGTFGLLIGKLMILILLIGWIYRVYQKQWSIADSFVIGYCLLLILYEGVSGIRFLIPILPMLLLYWMSGLTLITKQLEAPKAINIKIAFISFFILTLLPGTWTLIRQANAPIKGPNLPEAQEAFAYVQNNISAREATAFQKPWVFHYYTGRTSMAINPKNGEEGFSMDYLVDKMTRFKVEHLLVSIDPEDVAVHNRKLVSALQEDSRFTERWRNDAFVFLSLNGE